MTISPRNLLQGAKITLSCKNMFFHSHSQTHHLIHHHRCNHKYMKVSKKDLHAWNNERISIKGHLADDWCKMYNAKLRSWQPKYRKASDFSPDKGSTYNTQYFRENYTGMLVQRCRSVWYENYRPQTKVSTLYEFVGTMNSLNMCKFRWSPYL